MQRQVIELERLRRLRRFLAPQVADLLVSAEGETLLESHRRQVAVVCCQMPGFAALADATAPEEVLGVLHAYHEALGRVFSEFEGTVGPLVEDRLTILFNDPLPTEDPAGQAVRLALAMRSRMLDVLHDARKMGHMLDFGVGIDLGYATLGTIGFEGKTEYGAIGTVGQLAARLCDLATEQQILVSQRGAGVPLSRTNSSVLPEAGPLTEREREVVNLIVQGCSNREIAGALVIAEGTAVRHVANVLNKRNLHSRAQVAVWAVQRAQAGGSAGPGAAQ